MIDIQKIRRLAKSNHRGHLKVSTPARVRGTNVDVLDWSLVKSQTYSKKMASDDFLRSLVVQAFANHQEDLSQEIDILKDPKRVVKLDPDKYLYTHASIIISVNVEENDHYITADTSDNVNKNGDAWETKLLAKTYPSFIGAYNYLEHVQIPEMRKGWIIDAVPRKIGKVMVVDILVATDRRHKSLVSAIEKGDLNCLSMGCTAKFTICSKCGYVLKDESDKCAHIPHHKLDTFTDEKGVKRVVAELCGHASDPESNKFEEASWVHDPAFEIASVRHKVASVGHIQLLERSSWRKLFAEEPPAAEEFQVQDLGEGKSDSPESSASPFDIPDEGGSAPEGDDPFGSPQPEETEETAESPEPPEPVDPKEDRVIEKWIFQQNSEQKRTRPIKKVDLNQSFTRT